MRGRLDGVADPHARLFKELLRTQLWLRDDIDGTLGQCRQRDVRTASGESRTDDHRNRMLAHQPVEER